MKHTPLPCPQDNHEIEIRSSEPSIESAAIRKAKEAKMTEIENSKYCITVSDTLRGAHPLVSESRKLLESAERDEEGFLKRIGGCLHLHVSKKNLHRALLLMDAMIKALEEHGFPVSIAGCTTQTQVLGVTVKFGVFETLVDLKEEVDEPQDLKGDYRFHHSSYRFKKVPSGQMCFRIDPDETYYWRYGSGVRGKWADSEKRRLEDHLGGVLEGFLKVAAIKRDAELKAAEEKRRREEAQKQWEEQERRRAEMWEKIQTEQHRVDHLLSDAEYWRRSSLLREYIEAVRTSTRAKELSTEERSEANEWVRWAAEQADRLDPLKPSPPSILDDQDKYRPPHESKR
jgi:hypothetical protein